MGLRSVHRKIFFIFTFCLVTKVFVSIRSELIDTTTKTKRDTQEDETIPAVTEYNPVPPMNDVNVEAKNGAFALKTGNEDPSISSDKKKKNLQVEPGLKKNKEEIDAVIEKQNGAFSLKKKKRLKVQGGLKEGNEAKNGAFSLKRGNKDSINSVDETQKKMNVKLENEWSEYHTGGDYNKEDVAFSDKVGPKLNIESGKIERSPKHIKGMEDIIGQDMDTKMEVKKNIVERLEIKKPMIFNVESGVAERENKNIEEFADKHGLKKLTEKTKKNVGKDQNHIKKEVKNFKGKPKKKKPIVKAHKHKFSL